MARAEFRIEFEQEVIILTDKNSGESITNDADLVIETLYEAHQIKPTSRIVYPYTGRWDGLAHRRGHFSGFVLLGARSRQEAIEAALARPTWIEDTTG